MNNARCKYVSVSYTYLLKCWFSLPHPYITWQRVSLPISIKKLKNISRTLKILTENVTSDESDEGIELRESLPQPWPLDILESVVCRRCFVACGSVVVTYNVWLVASVVTASCDVSVLLMFFKKSLTFSFRQAQAGLVLLLYISPILSSHDRRAPSTSGFNLCTHVVNSLSSSSSVESIILV